MSLIPRMTDDFMSPFFTGFPDMTRELTRGFQPLLGGTDLGGLATRGMPIDVVSGGGARILCSASLPVCLPCFSPNATTRKLSPPLPLPLPLPFRPRTTSSSSSRRTCPA